METQDEEPHSEADTAEPTSPQPAALRPPEAELEDVSAWLRRLEEQVQAQDQLLDRVAPPEAPGPTAPADADSHRSQLGERTFITRLPADDYPDELDALRTWVQETLIPIYGREVSTAAPWCPWWHTHPEAVARLHALWMAWEQLTAPEAGATGPALWHRDFLDHTWPQLRAANGPFAACTTNPRRCGHRILPPPPPADGPPPLAGDYTSNR